MPNTRVSTSAIVPSAGEHSKRPFAVFTKSASQKLVGGQHEKASVALALAVMLASAGNAMAQATIGAEARLKEKNITLPPPPAAIANYVGAVQVGNLLFASGNTAGPDGPKGKVGKELTVEQCYEAARQTGLRVLATVRATLGSLDRVKRV